MIARGRNIRLGRGLAALLGEIPPEFGTATQVRVRLIPLDLLEPNPYQPRTHMDQEALIELASSIRSSGILQPLLVRPHPLEPTRVQIVAGERRWRAAALAGLHEVPVLDRDMTDNDAAVAALVENLQRRDLNPMEEAEGYQRLMTEFNLTQESLGTVVGKSRAHIGNVVRLLKLPDQVKNAVRTGVITFGHARALLGHKRPETMLEDILARGLSVRETEALPVTFSTDSFGLDDASREAVSDLEVKLMERTGYQIKIQLLSRGAGKITIKFRELDQLDDLAMRLMTKITS